VAPITIGLVADRLLGEPPAPVHPVAAFGRAMQHAETRWYADNRAAGAAYAATGVTAAAAIGWLAGRVGRGRAALAAATYIVVAGRALSDAAATVAAALTAGGLAEARAHLPALVGRDPTDLDETEVARAVIESVAENTVDAIVAPALWGAAGGAPAALAYRAVNTLDAMVGHRSPRYTRFGWAAARADDVANWLPARVTATLVAVVRPTRGRAVWDCVRWQAPGHPSPNAGVAEAAFAAALDLQVGGRSVYDGRVEDRPALGNGRSPTAADIARAVRLSRDVTAALAVAGALSGWLAAQSGRGRSRR
jgi:adenosylcobinamide-phosphate synthase